MRGTTALQVRGWIGPDQHHALDLMQIFQSQEVGLIYHRGQSVRACIVSSDLINVLQLTGLVRAPSMHKDGDCVLIGQLTTLNGSTVAIPAQAYIGPPLPMYPFRHLGGCKPLVPFLPQLDG